jgi:predicted transcriptional regulator
VDRGQAQNKAIKHVLSRFFDNSAEMLVMNLLETEQLDSEDLRRIQSLMQQEERP